MVITTALSASLAGCAVGPDYLKPQAPMTPAFKEIKGWKLATPRDTFDHGQWWKSFKDPKLDDLEAQVEINNQTIAGYAARFEQAAALIQQAQAGYLPTASASYGATVNGTGAATLPGVANPSTTYNFNLPASWVPDLWGKVRRQVESNVSSAQADAADLAGARLSAQGQLAIAYFNLRASDTLLSLLRETVARDRTTLQVARNQYKAGTVSKADVVTADTQVLAVEAQEAGAYAQRQQYEHAIAILIGKPPADLTLSPTSWNGTFPDIPIVLPSELLERRPDVASAERNMQAQNALIGAAIATYFPTVSLSASLLFSGPNALPLTAAQSAWSLASSASEQIFDGGLRSAQIDAAKAGYRQSVANYRQTVLTAFGQVEDNLVLISSAKRQLAEQTQAVAAARESVRIYANQYRQGLVAITAVVTAQASLFSAEQSALTTRQSLHTASINLIMALGGGFDAATVPDAERIAKAVDAIKK